MSALEEIDPPELSRRLAAPEAPVVVDVREPWELDICRLPDSVDVPLGELPGRIMSLPADRPLVILCHHGMRSRRAALWLRAQGIERVSNLRGGIDAWARTVDPGMRTY
ncbi:MAG: sulfurtransferase [Rhodospirillales bacterium]|nr:MAG: sulfurtransferase [Rhodospirillales bacterium]